MKPLRTMSRRNAVQLLSLAILLVGLGSAVALYRMAGEDTTAILGYEEEGGTAYAVRPENSKTYQRDLELYGGTAALVADQLRRWLAGLWHGKNLAYMVACLTIVLSYGVFLAGERLGKGPPSDIPPDRDQGEGPA